MVEEVVTSISEASVTTSVEVRGPKSLNLIMLFDLKALSISENVNV